MREGILEGSHSRQRQNRADGRLRATWEYQAGTRLEGFVEVSSKRGKIKGFIGDGAYDSRRSLSLLYEMGIEPS